MMPDQDIIRWQDWEGDLILIKDEWRGGKVSVFCGQRGKDRFGSDLCGDVEWLPVPEGFEFQDNHIFWSD